MVGKLNMSTDISKSATETIALRRGKSLTTIVSEEIERLIISGHLKPGERINEHRLAESLDVNRGVLREARSGLVRSGLLVSVPNRGVFVRVVSDGELFENSEMREVITGFICQQAARKATDEDRQRLRDILAQLNTAVADHDGQKYDQANTYFHQTLMTMADHGRAAGFYDDLVRESHLARKLVLTEQKQMKSSNVEHTEIVNAILEGDSERAREAGERHVRNGRYRWLQTLENP
jgi:DNA-binding GntR family transcriptional regulator